MVKELTPEEQYISNQNPEMTVGDGGGFTDKFFKVFPALKSRNYKLYFTGQMISLIGTWLQTVAQGWLVLQLTNSAFLLGLIAAIGAIPIIPFSLFGGFIVDRFSKQKIILLTQASAMILAFILGILAVLNLITVWEIGILALLLGIVHAIDAPARQAFAVEMVGKEDLSSAINLNSAVFNAARVIGPGLAGFLIAWVGVGGAFMINGLSYIAAIMAIYLVRPKRSVSQIHPHPLKAIKEGLRYGFTHPIIQILLIFLGVISIFGWPFATILPIIVRDTFGSGAEGLGYLYAASGLGATLAAFSVSILSRKLNPGTFLWSGGLVYVLAMLGFTFTSQLNSALPFLFLSGVGLIFLQMTINTTIQHLVEDQYRGRVMSLYVIMFVGFSPIGSFQMGFFAEHLNWQFAIRLSTIIVFLCGLLVYLNRKRISVAHGNFKNSQA